MAIYHLSVKSISRKNGRSATASSAYRSAVRIKDDRTGEIFDYRKKRGVIYDEIILPPDAPVELRNRSYLWNLAEYVERRRDANVAREIEISLPHELPQDDQITLAVDFAKSVSNNFSVVIDVAIHKPQAKWSDSRNVHAHLLISTRVIDAEKGFGAKTRELDVSKSASKIVERWREEWSNRVNCALKNFDIDKTIDHRSYQRQGVIKQPQPNLSAKVLSLERDGIQTDRGDAWRKWKKQQQEVEELQMELEKITQEQEENQDENNQEGQDSLDRFPGIILANNVLKTRQKAKLRILEKEYQQKILNYDFIHDLRYVKKGKSRLEIKIKGGGQLIDLGDRVVADRMTVQKSAEHISTLAVAKGWKSVTLTGSEAFKAQAWLELKKKGIEVVGYEPPQKIKAKWEAIKSKGNIAPVTKPEPQISNEVTDWKQQKLKPDLISETRRKRKMKP